MKFEHICAILLSLVLLVFGTFGGQPPAKPDILRGDECPSSGKTALCSFTSQCDSREDRAGFIHQSLFCRTPKERMNNPVFESSLSCPNENLTQYMRLQSRTELIDDLDGSERPQPEAEELTDDQKVFIATIYAEATTTARGLYVSPLARQAVANVIMNRIGCREWSAYKTAGEICAFTGFSAYGNDHYQECIDYLGHRDGSHELIEQIIAEVLPVYNGCFPDITGGAQIFYTPAAMPPHEKNPGWNSSLLKEVIISGVDPYYEGRFFRYK